MLRPTETETGAGPGRHDSLRAALAWLAMLALVLLSPLIYDLLQRR